MTNEIKETNIDEKLGLLEYKADHNFIHIKIKENSLCADKCADKPCTTVCPANVYNWEETQKKIIISHENCIECGAARMLCPFNNIDYQWPRGGFGVKYKLG